ncbi:TPA: hypothetical protein VBN88_001172 [Streptococcus agalactiae]|uniref:hypothetical protein n=1 Tax=Streptococcus agalactiae TaxID=1311 RepID=UPI0002B98BE5|nr:hypothetical protein [Streptococcus agalactiae]EPU47118.1 hypothetical protein SAG0181_11625 [Streptococcus agalactiae LDS 628]EPX17248.1 hypothetical protein SAG0176_11215 [Streptococcus agalactiae LDS 623]HEM9149404.1 hypothetical protein [Streptococcus agalactiae]HEM9602825.1 hypothetical protein [Streptococcus agalactiae]HEM9657859.1 hypothetical protein [Streptococcus agalactiae]
MDNSKLENHQKVTVVCTDFNVYLNGIRLTGARPETAKLAERCEEKLITLSLVVTDFDDHRTPKMADMAKEAEMANKTLDWEKKHFYKSNK